MARRKRRRRRRRSTTRRAPAPRRRSRRRGNPHGKTTLKSKAYVAGGAALYGYVKHRTTWGAKIPVFTTIGAPASAGLLAHLVARNTSGGIRKWADLVSTGALAVAGYNLGSTGFNFEEAAAMEGGEHGELSGGVGYGDDWVEVEAD